MPNLFGSTFVNDNLKKLLSGFNQVGGNSLNNMPTGINGESPEDQTGAEVAAARIGQGLQKGFTTALNFNTINNSGLNSTQKSINRLDAGVDAVSSFASMIPGVGGIIGGALGGLNKLGGSLIGNPKIVKDYIVNDQVASSSGYTGAANSATEGARSAETYKGAGLFGKLFGKGKVKDQLGKANEMQTRVSKELSANELIKNRATSSTDLFATNNKNKLYGQNAWNNGSVQYGKNGTQLNFKRIAKEVYQKRAKTVQIEKTPVEVIKSHKEGGNINVIVDGALHARKHNLKELEHLKDAEITDKGVAVVTLAEGGEVTQHAEVEKDELILHKGLSNQLELLEKENSDEAMIQAGRILAREIVKNTRDSKSKILKGND